MSARWLPAPLPPEIEQLLFWIGIVGEVLIIGAELYVAWTHGWVNPPI